MNDTESSITKDNLDTILKKRAQDLAKEKSNNKLVNTSMILSFILGDEGQYAFFYEDIYKVCDMASITPVPNIHPLFSGIVHINSESWPVINMHQLLTINEPQESASKQIILATNNDKKLAFVVDKITGLLPFSGELKPVQESKGGVVKGIFDCQIAVLDVEKIFALIMDYTDISKN